MGQDFLYPYRPAQEPIHCPVQGVPYLFPSVKWRRCGINDMPLSSAKLKERVELHLYSSFWSLWPVTFISGLQTISGYSLDYITK